MSEITANTSFDLTKFNLTKVLSNDSRGKTIFLLGTFPDISLEDQA